MKTKYPDIEVELSEQDGNAFSIIGRVSKALRKANVPQGELESFRKEATSGDYDNVIQTAMKWVNVI